MSSLRIWADEGYIVHFIIIYVLRKSSEISAESDLTSLREIMNIILIKIKLNWYLHKFIWPKFSSPAYHAVCCIVTARNNFISTQILKPTPDFLFPEVSCCFYLCRGYLQLCKFSPPQCIFKFLGSFPGRGGSSFSREFSQTSCSLFRNFSGYLITWISGSHCLLKGKPHAAIKMQEESPSHTKLGVWGIFLLWHDTCKGNLLRKISINSKQKYFKDLNWKA